MIDTRRAIRQMTCTIRRELRVACVARTRKITRTTGCFAKIPTITIFDITTRVFQTRTRLRTDIGKHQRHPTEKKTHGNNKYTIQDTFLKELTRKPVVTFDSDYKRPPFS